MCLVKSRATPSRGRGHEMDVANAGACGKNAARTSRLAHAACPLICNATTASSFPGVAGISKSLGLGNA